MSSGLTAKGKTIIHHNKFHQKMGMREIPESFGIFLPREKPIWGKRWFDKEIFLCLKEYQLLKEWVQNMGSDHACWVWSVYISVLKTEASYLIAAQVGVYLKLSF